MDAIHKLVSFARNLRYEDLPQEAVDLIKQDFLDYCGNTLAGSSDPSVRRTIEQYTEWGGKPECTVFAYGTKLPSIHAALLNSAMGFAMDYDDTHMQGGHIGVTVFPAALALSELNRAVSGRDFLTAAAAGMEIICRLGVYNTRRVPRHIFGGWCYQALHASFSSAVTAGKLMNLDQETFLDAMGLAYHQAAGTGLSALEHADTKILGPGFGTRNGLTSVFLAKRGVTGAHNVLEGDYGLGLMYHNGCDAKGITAGLGKDFELLNIGFKPFSSCRLGHRTLVAVRELVLANDIKPEEVQSVHIRGSKRVIEQLYDPAESTKNPDCRTAAVFSLPWVVSSMILRRKVGVAELSEEALADRAVHALAQRVFAEVDESVDPADHATPMPVVIKTLRGEFKGMTQSIALGDRGNRIPQDELIEKYYDNASFCVKALSSETKKILLETIRHLEDVADMREIVKLLS
jgi:2-methylcitrate dehydratase PrpD